MPSDRNLVTLSSEEGVDPALWRLAQASLSLVLAEAAQALGRLEGQIAALPAAVRKGAIHRLALLEVEAMLWAQGIPLARDEIGRDLMDLRAGTDLEALHLARWAIRRLEGQGGLADLRGFLGLHRPANAPAPAGDLAPRPTGEAFDASAAAFLAGAERLSGLHPLTRAPALRLLWRLAGLSPPGLRIEAAVWSARAMIGDRTGTGAAGGGLSFVPLGRAGRIVWIMGGDPAEQSARHLEAVRDGCGEARAQLIRLAAWSETAAAATAPLKGDNPDRVLAVLLAHPLASAAMVETQAGISRLTAERQLNRLTGMGLIREVTGTKRFRLWAAAV